MHSIEASGYGSEAQLLEELEFYASSRDFKKVLECIFLKIISKMQSFCFPSWNWFANFLDFLI